MPATTQPARRHGLPLRRAAQLGGTLAQTLQATDIRELPRPRKGAADTTDKAAWRALLQPATATIQQVCAPAKPSSAASSRHTDNVA